jgi:hypothetical protein
MVFCTAAIAEEVKITLPARTLILEHPCCFTIFLKKTGGNKKDFLRGEVFFQIFSQADSGLLRLRRRIQISVRRIGIRM